MGDEEGGDPDLALQPLEPGPCPLPELGVEIGERLVEEQDTRRVDQCPGQGDALLLATGDLVGVTIAVAAHLDQIESFTHACPQSSLSDASDAQGEGHVVEDREVRPDGVRLEDQAEVAVLRRQVDARITVVEDVVAAADPPTVGALEAGDGHERGRLAATARPEEGQQLLVEYLEVDCFQDLGVPEGLGQP